MIEERYYCELIVSFPGECIVQKPLHLTLKFNMLLSGDLNKANLRDSSAAMDLRIHISASTFSIDDSWRDVSLLYKKVNKIDISFNVIPRQCGKQTIAIETFHGARRLGFREIVTKVFSEGTEIKKDTMAKEVRYENEMAILPVVDSSPVKETRRVIHVSRDFDAPDVLKFVIDSPANKGETLHHSKKVGTEVEVMTSLQAYLNTLDKMVVANESNSSASADWLINLAAIGQDLFETIIPAGIRAEISSWEDNSMVGISTDESWIPWELFHDGKNFLCRRFVLYRLPRRSRDFDNIPAMDLRDNPASQNIISEIINSIADNIDDQMLLKIKAIIDRIEIDGIESVDPSQLALITDCIAENCRVPLENLQPGRSFASESMSTDKHLYVWKILNIIGGNLFSSSTRELENIFDFAGDQCTIVNLKPKGISDLVRDSQNTDIFHFTCHGKHPPGLLPFLQISTASSNEIGKNLLLSAVRMLSIKKGCLVFINACKSESAQLLFKEFFNFGWKFYEEGARLCVGTLTSIPQSGAIRFSEEFYKNLLVKKLPVKDALAAAREDMIGKGKYFPLFYSIYGDPSFHVYGSTALPPRNTANTS